MPDRIPNAQLDKMLGSTTLREGSLDHDLLADLRDARVERTRLRSRIERALAEVAEARTVTTAGSTARAMLDRVSDLLTKVR